MPRTRPRPCQSTPQPQRDQTKRPPTRREATQQRAARTALAVERYRRTRGPLPQKLDDLVPEFMDAIPIDPFDGKPMRYNKLEMGYVVYCIGPDGDDDGGKEREPGGGDDHDVPFTVAR